MSGTIAEAAWTFTFGEVRDASGYWAPMVGNLHADNLQACSGSPCESYIEVGVLSSPGEYELDSGPASIFDQTCEGGLNMIRVSYTGRVRIDEVTSTTVSGALCIIDEYDDGSTVELSGTFELARCP